jgi:hypothetical protein
MKKLINLLILYIFVSYYINMTSMENVSDPNKNDITNLAKEYKKKNSNTEAFTSSISLTQGEKFKNNQKRIKKHLVKKANRLSSGIESFTGIDLSSLDLSADGLTEQSNEIIQNNDYSSQQQSIAALKQHYQDTLTQYQTLWKQISGSATNYVNRVNPKNPYLNKNVVFSTGDIAYVTNQGVAKLYSSSVMSATAGLNGCPASKNFTKINLPWLTDYNTPGTSIPTANYPLISGSPMVAGQSCGNEGLNVYVNNILNNPTAKYVGSYADNTSSPLMSFVGNAPSTFTVNLQNANFQQPQISGGSYQYINSTSMVTGWYFNAVLLNSSGAWGYPTPYPTGSQAACIQANQSLYQYINLLQGSYIIRFYSCGRPGYSGANPINVFCIASSSFTTPQQATASYTFTPSTSAWNSYTTTITITTSGNYAFGFYGTNSSGNYSSAIQGISISSSGTNANGAYTYAQCLQTSLDGGYRYFSLQNVNQTNSQGYCAVSNDLPSATSLGISYIPSGQVPIWASRTAGQTGNSAILSITGSLSVVNSGGTSVSSTSNSKAQPSGFLGCYGDSSSRAMPLYNNGSQSYNLSACQSIAKQNNATYFGLQNSKSGSNAQCALSSNLSQTTKYGKAGNCTTTTNGTISGGGWSNAVYTTGLNQSNYYLILQDDGNMCVYRGTRPSDNQGLIWASNTQGKQQQPNPVYAAVNGKYGQNWIASGSTLAAGDFVGSTNGNLALIMQGDGNLVLYTFKNVVNSRKMADSNIGGGLGANGIYDLGSVGITSNMGKLAYIDADAGLHVYPSSNTQYINSYANLINTDSPGNDISGAAYGNATVQNCQTTCNNNSSCAGFAFSTTNNVCYPKTSGMYPTGTRVINPGVNLYMRNAIPQTPQVGALSTTNNIDTVKYQNYVSSSSSTNPFSIYNMTSVQQQQLSQLQGQLDLLSNQITNLTGNFGSGTNLAETQMGVNVLGVDDYLTDLSDTNNKIVGFDTHADNILNDSDIVVLQKNYEYLFWSILATGSVLVAMNIVKK